MDNIYYRAWKRYVLDYLTYIGINYGMIGDRVTAISDNGSYEGSLNLVDAWLNKLSIIEILNVLSPKRGLK